MRYLTKLRRYVWMFVNLEIQEFVDCVLARRTRRILVQVPRRDQIHKHENKLQVVVIASAVISVLSMMAEFGSPWDFVNNIYMALFGLMMLVIDFPVNHPRVHNMKIAVFHYALFMTRFVGRGIWYSDSDCYDILSFVKQLFS